ncbi:MAG: SCO family protein [Gammaproteobacteria bacterium]|nr:SCO family protein [Gammaproteobacteria bacterium]
MQLTRNIKLGLLAFAVIDLLLVVVFISLLTVRPNRQQASELRDLGATVYQQPRPLDRFELVDQHGSIFSSDRLRGRWSMLFFGFTSCPDICPLTMVELKQFYQLLKQANTAPLPQIVLVTVDPQRDTPATMASYISSFNDEFIGLGGDAQSLSALADQLYVAHTASAEAVSHDGIETAEHEHTIEHSGHISVINPDGELYAALRLPHRDRDLLAAYLQLVSN